MNLITSRTVAAGFALVESLVALLLLAIALMGAGAALVQSLAGQRTALLQTQAADLAGNLAEALRAAPDAAQAAREITDWRAAVQLQLPQVDAAVTRIPAPPVAGLTGLPACISVHLQWRDGRLRTPGQLTLPLGIAALPAPGT